MRIELSMPMSATEVAKATNARIYDVEERWITHIVTDSREVMPGDLFIALKGKNSDGEDYADDALASGAVAVSTQAKTGTLQVVNTSSALLDLASYYIKKLPYIKYKVGVTGSVGKTTTKEFLKVILSERFITHATHGNFNNEIGMPLTLLSTPKNAEVLICEMGMNQSGEISKMSKALSPNIALITNIGTAHIGNLGSRENIARAKLEIIDGMDNGVLLTPASEPLLSGLRFGFNDATAHFNLTCDADNKIDFYSGEARIPIEKFLFRDEHLLLCLSAALSVSSVCGLVGDELNRGVFKISGENIRQKIVNKKNISFYADCYNASEESVYAALKSLSSLSGYAAKSAVLGDILELGEHSKAIHHRIGERIPAYNIERLYLVGKESIHIRDGAIKAGFPAKSIFYNSDASRQDITASDIKKSSKPHEIILLKASRAIGLEKILELFD